MTIDRVVMAVAGTFVLVSLAIAHFTENTNWLWFTGFVGANLLQASFTGFCPMVKILKALGVQPGQAFK